MEDRTDKTSVPPSWPQRLPPPDLVLSPQEKIAETLQLVMEKQQALERRILILMSKVNARIIDTRISSISPNLSPPSDFLSLENCSLPFQLSLVEPVLTPLCKGRYFNLKVSLEGPSPLPCNVRVEVMAFTSGSTPQRIENNMSGAPFIRGEYQATLQCDLQFKSWGTCLKLQLSEVSSHFPNGWVYVVVQAKDPKYYTQIKPLVLGLRRSAGKRP